MRVLFCGGGTAGHVNPSIAIYETILKNKPNSKFAYVATLNGIENTLVKFKKYHINVRGLKRSLSLSNFKTGILALKAIKRSKEIIKEFMPDIIVGTGGYATYPVIVAGHKLGIKTIIHESNAIPGKSIKMLEKYADKILVNFEETKRFFKKPSKVVHTGNPVRQGFDGTNKEGLKNKNKIKEKFVIACYGGSLGAEKINEAAIEVIDNLIKYRDDILFILSTGKKDYERVMKLLKEKHLSALKNILVVPYIENMPEVIGMADVVVSRAGAMSISELAISQKCAIFVPSPNVAENHQYKNAKLLENAGASVLVNENTLYQLTDTLRDLLENGEKRNKMENRIKEFANKNSNKIIYNEILSLLNR